MTQKELEFVLRMRDEASVTWNTYKTTIQTGSQNVRDSLIRSGNAVKDLSKAHSSLSGILGTEQRHQDALSAAVVRSDLSYKNANNSLQALSEKVLNAGNNTKVLHTQLSQLSRDEVDKRITVDVDLNVKAFGERLSGMMETVKPYLGQLQKGFSFIGTAANNQATVEINALRKARNEAVLASNEKKKTELDRIDALLQSESISEEKKKQLRSERSAIEKKYAGEEEALRERYQQKEREAKARVFQANKNSAMLSAVINTAEGVTKALAQGGFLAGIPMAAIITAMGAAELSLISSQQAPQFHQGGVMGRFGERVPLRTDEHPAVLRAGETVRTEAQEARLHEGRQSGGNTFVFNFSGVISTPEALKKIVQEGMRQVGVQDVNNYFVNTRAKVVLR